MLKRHKLLLFWLVISIFLTWTAFASYEVAAYARYSGEKPADAIVVLGAAVWRGRPSPVFRERINHALELYEQGYASTLIFTGGLGYGDDLAEAAAARHYAIDSGVPPEDILIETTSTTTAENLHYARLLAAEHGLNSLIIVSDPLHMKRAMLIAGDMGLEAYSSPTPTSRYRSWRTQLSFLIRETHYYQRYLLLRLFEDLTG